MNGWKTSFLLEWPIFRGYVSFGEGSLKDFLELLFHPAKLRKMIAYYFHILQGMAKKPPPATLP